MKTPYYITIFAAFILIIQGCEDYEGQNNTKVIGTGPVVTRNLDLSSFNKIENTGVANFYITIGSPQSILLKAQQNIIDVMTYEVVNQSLKIGIKKDVSIENYEEIRFDITIPEITNIKLLGIGDFELSGDDQSDLSINLTGVGNINSYGMKVNNCDVTLTGVGDCKVNVISKLNVIITGVGFVYYQGTPAITSTITGVGKLIDDN
jgi:hypothetical protein